MSFRAVFTSFDHFMTMFVAVFAVAWSTAFMPLLGGPLHNYEARAIGAGWHSLKTGEAATLHEAFEIATSLPSDAVFPSAHAAELPLQVASVAAHEPGPMELLGGPDVALPFLTVSERYVGPRPTGRVTPVSASSALHPAATDTCDRPTREQEPCDALRSGEPLAAST